MIVLGIILAVLAACTLGVIIMAMFANAVMKVDEEVQEMKR